MSPKPEDDDLEPEYDFSEAVRGKYYQRYREEYETVREVLIEERRQKAIRAVALRNAAGRVQEAP